MARKSLSSVDTAWLRMEDPTNLMMITGVMIFGAPIDMDRLKATLEHRLLRFDRFRQRVAPPRLPLGRYCWVDDPQFDLNDHVQRITLAPPGDKATLQKVVSQLMSTPLDFSKSLWQLHLVENYGDGCALVARLHHCIADGIALVRVLLSLTDADPDAPWPTAELTGRGRDDGRLFSTWFRPASTTLKATAQITQTLLQKGQEILGAPSRALELAHQGANSATTLGRLVLLWPDPGTLFKGKLGVEKRATWSTPIPLTQVKKAGRAMGGTVNDVLLTAVTGALRRYMQSRAEPVENVNFRAVVPVNLRPLEEEITLGNRFGLVFLSLPVGIGDPLERLRELKRRMDTLKGTPEALVAFGILNAIGLAPSEIQDIVINIFGAKGTGVMTNVPGPQETMYLAGAPLNTIMFWVPQSGHLGLGVSILSYAGQVWLGIATDKGLVPDPESIIAAFHVEFDELLSLTQQIEASAQEMVEPTPASAVAEMIATLNAAIQKLDALSVKGNAPPKQTPSEKPTPDATVEPASDRCQALTRAGQPCKNHPLSGSKYCRVHQTQ